MIKTRIEVFVLEYLEPFNRLCVCVCVCVCVQISSDSFKNNIYKLFQIIGITI